MSDIRKRTPAFATKGNPTTRENISNVFGAKTLVALVPLDLEFTLTPTKKTNSATESRTVKIFGHISRPVVGEGRNAPDRQMFFVNSRPCILPQISKAFNEVYKSFNVTQSPFIFADLIMDTNAYDINVSPDKRTILLHDQTELLENLKTVLNELFENHEQTLPANQLGGGTHKGWRQTSLFAGGEDKGRKERDTKGQYTGLSEPVDAMELGSSPAPLHGLPGRGMRSSPPIAAAKVNKGPPQYHLTSNISRISNKPLVPFKPPTRTTTADMLLEESSDPMREEEEEEEEIPSTQPPPDLRPPRMRPTRKIDAVATITIGDREPVTVGRVDEREEGEEGRRKRRKIDSSATQKKEVKKFGGALSQFLAPGTQVEKKMEDEEEKEIEDEDMEVVEVQDEEEADEEEEEIPVRRQRSLSVELSFAPISSPKELPEELRRGAQPGFEEVEDACCKKADENPLFLGPDPEDSDEEGEPEGEGQEKQERRAEIEVEEEPEEDREEEEAEEAEEAKEAEEEAPPPEHPESLDDDDYHPTAASAAKKRAARRLAEATISSEDDFPIEVILIRPLSSFYHSRPISTVSHVSSVSTSLGTIRRLAGQYHQSLKSPSSSQHGISSAAADESEAETRLTLTVSKEDFFNMRIHGQFNLGFILASRGTELFIIDQHASDEKYNFETLQSTTIVQSQPLVVPRVLDLMAMDELAVSDHLDVFRRNGFVVEVDAEAPTGQRCRLMSLPMSKETVFGVEDLEEIVHLIHQHQGAALDSIRPKKTRAMFAMRACRKSVMVGKALTKKQMERIVRNMGEMEKPWNCPHGRPTMRHLAELGGIKRWDERRMGGEIKWGGESWAEVVESYGEVVESYGEEE